MTLNIIVVIALVVLGVVFLLIEIFLLPGVSIAAIAGALFTVGGIVYAYMFIGNTAGTISLVSAVLLLSLTFVWLVKSKSLQKIGLKTNIEETVDNSSLKTLHPGDKGTAVSRLNPIGKVMINDVMVEGKSFDGEFIDEESQIEVIKVDTYHVLVKKINESIINSTH